MLKKIAIALLLVNLQTYSCILTRNINKSSRVLKFGLATKLGKVRFASNSISRLGQNPVSNMKSNSLDNFKGVASTNMRYKTADQTPEFAKYNADLESCKPAMFKIAPFNYFYMFEENKNDNHLILTYVSSNSEFNREELFSNGKKTEKSGNLTSAETDINKLFQSLNLSWQIEIRKDMMSNLFILGNGLKLQNVMSMIDIFNKLTPSLKSHYSMLIMDLALNRRKHFERSLHIESVLTTNSDDEQRLIALKTFIALKQNKSVIGKSLDFFGSFKNNLQLTSNPVIEKNSEPANNNKSLAVVDVITEDEAQKILGVNKFSTKEEIKKSYFKMRLQNENDKEKVELLKRAYEKLIIN